MKRLLLMLTAALFCTQSFAAPGDTTTIQTFLGLEKTIMATTILLSSSPMDLRLIVRY